MATTVNATVTHVEREGRRKVDEYRLIADDGTVLAVAHCVGVQDDTWSVNGGGRFLGIARGRDGAVRALEQYATRIA